MLFQSEFRGSSATTEVTATIRVTLKNEDNSTLRGRHVIK